PRRESAAGGAVRVAVGLAAFNLTILVVGFALLYALGAARLRRRDLWLAGLAYLAGWGLLGVVLVLAVLAGVDPRLWHVLALAFVLVVACGLVGGRRPPEELLRRGRRTLLGGTVAGVGAIVLAIAAVSALIVAVQGEWPSEWDSWSIWVPRAETIYSFHGL